MNARYDQWVDYLYCAERQHAAVDRLSAAEPGLTLDDAYEIQDRLIARRISAGERIVGVKLGLTSAAKRRDMGIDEPIYGWLTSGMQLPSPASVDLRELIHPRAEPEIVFELGEDLAGPGVTPLDVLDVTRGVRCGLEVIDSRYAGFQFNLVDVVADNTSASQFVLGSTRVSVSDLVLPSLRCQLLADGVALSHATGAAVMGDPAAAVAQLANFLATRGQRLEAGWLVLSGGMTSAVELADHRDVRAEFDALGSVELAISR
ncbi:2-keto-4-pentenoate hydratase [Streptomyces sp. NPDC055078]